MTARPGQGSAAPRVGHLLGLDVGGTSIRAVLTARDAPHRVLDRWQHPTPQGAAALTAALRTVWAEVLRSPCLQPTGAGARAVDGLASVGIGIPGQVRDGTVSHAANLGVGAATLDLAGLFEELAPGLRCVVDNDVTTAALGASTLLRGRTPSSGSDLVLLNVGTGLAAGIVLGGQALRGAHHLAGEVGHLVRDPAGALCPCGQHGCFELTVSGRGLASRWAGTLDEAFTAADSGDPLAARVAEDLMGGLDQLVRILVQTLDIPHLVLAGGVVSGTPQLLPRLRTRLTPGPDAPPFVRALDLPARLVSLPPDYPAGALGAAVLPSNGA